jgi:hypothetical protein
MLSQGRLLVAALTVAGMAASPACAQEKIGTLLVAGDLTSCVDPHKGSAGQQSEKEKRAEEILSGRATAKLVIDEINKSKMSNPTFPVAVIGLGDLAYDCGTAKAFGCFEESWGTIRQHLKLDLDDRFLLVPGNHEYAPKRMIKDKEVCIKENVAKKEDKHARPFFEYYKADLAELGASTGSYSLNFPVGNDKSWHLIGLNPYGASAVDFLKQDLKDSQSRSCVLAFMHPFYYSSGFHGHGNSYKQTAKKQPEPFTKDYFKLLYDSGATVLLSGHDHHFEQLGRANANSAADSKRGLRSFIVGTGGKPLYSSVSYKDEWPFQEAIDRKDYGILKVDLYADHYEWEFIAVPPAASALMGEKKEVKSDTCNRPAN